MSDKKQSTNNKNKAAEYGKITLILIMGLLLILFTQWLKILKNPAKAIPITTSTLYGLLFLGLFSIIGILVHSLMQKQPIKIIKDFPILGWVSMSSLFFCIISPQVVEALNSVDFLSLTTPILTFAGISVANRLGDLRKLSWKIVIVGIFVFLGTYLGSAILAQIAFTLTRK